MLMHGRAPARLRNLLDFLHMVNVGDVNVLDLQHSARFGMTSRFLATPVQWSACVVTIRP